MSCLRDSTSGRGTKFRCSRCLALSDPKAKKQDIWEWGADGASSSCPVAAGGESDRVFTLLWHERRLDTHCVFLYKDKPTTDVKTAFEGVSLRWYP
jgi:hypothetical protein